MKAQRLTLVLASLLAAGAALYFYVSSKHEPVLAENDINARPEHPPAKPSGQQLFRHAIHEAKLISAARQEELHKSGPDH